MDQYPCANKPSTWNALPNMSSATPSSTKSPKSRKKSQAQPHDPASTSPTTPAEAKRTKKSSKKAKPEPCGLENFGSQVPNYNQWIANLSPESFKELNNLIAFTSQANQQMFPQGLGFNMVGQDAAT